MASAQKGEVKVWSVEKKRVLWRYTSLGTATITHLAFSPTENLIAWTDTDGVLTRWPSPIPSSAPDPVKTPRVSTNALQSKPRHGTPDLFADINSVKGGDALDADGLEDDMPAMDDDWIIDDIGGGMEDEPEKSRGIKEMGRHSILSELGIRLSNTSIDSEYHEGTTCFPTRVYTHESKETISR